ncbi:SIR2 family protein [Arthrobacter koreensis]|uniref:SIR2 family protein n=1 Tax=Arthrobacter koreensis TaxID=199136 RepID=UPI0036DB41C2
MDADDRHIVQEHLSNLLQVQNLVVLIGSGASFHLGSPQTRNLNNASVKGLVSEAGGSVDATDMALLQHLNPGDDGDLERLLNALQLAAALAMHTQGDAVTLGQGAEAQTFTVDELESLRHKIGSALVEACKLPRRLEDISPEHREDPLQAHRTFFSRLLRARRSNLPRPRIFTTNYDLVIERALDELGYPYVDGFSGTVDRRLNLSFYGLDFHRIDTSTQKVLARAESAVYVHKIHGSLNWRARTERDRITGVESLEVHQVPDDAPVGGDRVLIYPTTAKEGDTLAFPYSDLMRQLGDAVQQDDTAIISVGYGFADPHINRILLRSLAVNPALNVLVVDPKAVLDEQEMEEALSSDEVVGRPLNVDARKTKRTAVAALAEAADARIAVLTGDAGRFVDFADLMPDPSLGNSFTSPRTISDLVDSLELIGMRAQSESSNTGRSDV